MLNEKAVPDIKMQQTCSTLSLPNSELSLKTKSFWCTIRAVNPWAGLPSFLKAY